MPLPLQSLNLPISGGDSQDEDKYLRSKPSVAAYNMRYEKNGSLTKTPKYAQLVAGLTSAAVPIPWRDSLYVADDTSLIEVYSGTETRTRTFSAPQLPMPVAVTDRTPGEDGIEFFDCAVSDDYIVYAWSEPIAFTGWITKYMVTDRDHGLVVAPTVLVDPTTAATASYEEISVSYSGGWFVVSGIASVSADLNVALIDNANPTTTPVGSVVLGAPTSSRGVHLYEVTNDGSASAFYFIVQELQFTGTSYGNTTGVVMTIASGSPSYSRVTLSTIGGSTHEGSAGVAIKVIGSLLWIAVASWQHDNIYSYTTDLAFGSITARQTCHTFSGWDVWANAGISPATAAISGGTGVDTTYRWLRMAFCEDQASGVTLFWSGPVLDYDGSALSIPSTDGFQCATRYTKIANTNIPSGTVRTLGFSHMAAQPILRGTKRYAFLATPGPTTDTPSASPVGQVVQVSTTARPVRARFLVDELSGSEELVNRPNAYPTRSYSYETASFPRVATTSDVDSKWFFAAMRRRTGGVRHYASGESDVDSTTDTRRGYQQSGALVEVSYDEEAKTTAASSHTDIFLANGNLLRFDGREFYEASVPFVPAPPISVTQNAASSGGISETLQFRVSWSFVDSRGRTFRTTLSDATNIALSGVGGDVDFDVSILRPPPGLSQELGNLRLELWCSDGDTSLLAYAFDPDNLANPEDPGFQIVVPYPFLSTSFGRPLSPADSSVLQPEPTGPAMSVTQVGNRVWYTNADKPERAYFSLDFSASGQVDFNRANYVELPSGEAITALSHMDEQLVLFSATSAYILVGSLPNNTGGGGGFQVSRLASSHGCTNRRSVLSTEIGVLFESERGLNVLSRGLEVQFVGAPVAEFLSGGESVVGIHVDPANEEVVVATAALLCVLHLRRNRWTYVTDSAWGDIVASAMWKEGHSIIDDNGILYHRGTTQVGVPVTCFTPWYNVSALEALKRVRDIYVLGRATPTTTSYGSLTIGIQYDYEETTVETKTYEYAELSDLEPLRIRFKPARQKFSSFRFVINEVPELVGQSLLLDANLTLSGVTCEVALKAAGDKYPRTSHT